MKIQLFILATIFSTSLYANDFMSRHKMMFESVRDMHSNSFSGSHNTNPQYDNTNNATNSYITLKAHENGLYFTEGDINGTPINNMLIDTGASTVTLSGTLAKSLGLNLKEAAIVRMNSASRSEIAYKIRLDSIRIASLEFGEVEAIVTQSDFPKNPLIGSSLLSMMNLTFEGDELTLELK